MRGSFPAALKVAETTIVRRVSEMRAMKRMAPPPPGGQGDSDRVRGVTAVAEAADYRVGWLLETGAANGRWGALTSLKTGSVAASVEPNPGSLGRSARAFAWPSRLIRRPQDRSTLHGRHDPGVSLIPALSPMARGEGR